MKKLLFLIVGMMFLASFTIMHEKKEHKIEHLQTAKKWQDGPFDDEVSATNARNAKETDLINAGATIISKSTWWEPGPPDGEGRYYFCKIIYDPAGPPPPLKNN